MRQFLFYSSPQLLANLGKVVFFQRIRQRNFPLAHFFLIWLDTLDPAEPKHIVCYGHMLLALAHKKVANQISHIFVHPERLKKLRDQVDDFTGWDNFDRFYSQLALEGLNFFGHRQSFKHV